MKSIFIIFIMFRLIINSNEQFFQLIPNRNCYRRNSPFANDYCYSLRPVSNRQPYYNYGGVNRVNQRGYPRVNPNRVNNGFISAERLIPTDVREMIFAYSFLCDQGCPDPETPQKGNLQECLNQVMAANTYLSRVVQKCGEGLQHPELFCNNPNQRNRVNNCFLRNVYNRRDLLSPTIQSCFRNIITISSINCVLRRNRALNRLYPTHRFTVNTGQQYFQSRQLQPQQQQYSSQYVRLNNRQNNKQNNKQNNRQNTQMGKTISLGKG